MEKTQVEVGALEASLDCRQNKTFQTVTSDVLTSVSMCAAEHRQRGLPAVRGVV